MGYSIKITDQFLDEFEEISDYISNKLKNVDASNKLREKVIYNVLLLENSPKMCTEIEKTDRTERQYRRMVVNNYVILYTIDEPKKNSICCTYILCWKKLFRWWFVIEDK